MTPRKPKTMKSQQLGHYSPPMWKGPGHLNRPKVGRIGKMMPSIKQFRPLMGKRRG
jgi:hypothetical protein